MSYGVELNIYVPLSGFSYTDLQEKIKSIQFSLNVQNEDQSVLSDHKMGIVCTNNKSTESYKI